MLKLTEATIDIIADNIADYIKSQGKSLPKTPKVGGGSNENENLEQLWYNYIKRVDPHEKKYIVIINSMLTKQAREIIGNIKKYPNSYKKWTFNKRKWLGLFADAEAKFIVKLIKQEGQKAIDLALRMSRKSFYKAEDMPLSIAFDVFNPEVTDALISQTTRFPAGVVGTSEEIIRATINEGLELGENIVKLRKRVEERLGSTYIKNRAEMIARSETIYASNAGAELGYMQSGVVEGKKWLTAIDERTCDLCLDMDGRTALLQTSFDIDSLKADYGWKFDYTEGEMPHPPLHPRCRCTIIPIVETVEVFKPAKTIKEAEKYATKFSRGVSYKGLDLKTVNLINQNLDEMFKKYNLKPLWGIETKVMRYPAQANTARQRLILSTRLKEKGMQKGIEDYLKTGFLSGGKAKDIESLFQHIINHEMAHLQFSKYSVSASSIGNMKKIKSAYVRAIDKASKAGDITLYNKLKISDYAKTDLDEFIAEAFNDYRFSKTPSKFSKSAYELILEAIKKK